MILLIILNLVISLTIIKKFNMDLKIKKIIIIYIIYIYAILIVSKLNLYKLNSVNNMTYLMWIVTTYILIGMYYFIIKNQKEFKFNNELVVKKIVNSKLILIIQIILNLVLLFYAWKFYNITIKINDASQIRIAAFTILFNSYTENIIYNYFIITIYKITTIITTILLINKKYKNPIFILGILNILIKISIGYGRMDLYEFIIYIIIAKCISDVKMNFKSKNILKYIIIIFFILTVSLIPLSIRNGVSPIDFEKIYTVIFKEQLKQIVIYFTGGFRAFDIYMQNGFETIKGYTLGKATFGGIDEMFEIFIKFIGCNYFGFNTLVGAITQKNILIGDSVYFNAFYTYLMNFYSDFGYFGILIGPIVQAILIGFTTNNMKKNKSLASYILFAFTVVNLFSSIFRWNYQSGATMFMLIMISILNIIVNKKIVKSNKKKLLTESCEKHENSMDC